MYSDSKVQRENKFVQLDLVWQEFGGLQLEEPTLVFFSCHAAKFLRTGGRRIGVCSCLTMFAVQLCVLCFSRDVLPPGEVVYSLALFWLAVAEFHPRRRRRHVSSV